MKPKRQKKSRGETPQGIALFLIFTFAVCADSLMDIMRPLGFVVLAAVLFGGAWYMTWRGYK